MKKYALNFGLMMLLCCSSIVFACPHVITGTITITDQGSCQLLVVPSDFECDICGPITITDTDISCSIGTATLSETENIWDISGSGELDSGDQGYEFSVMVDCETTTEISEDTVISETYIAPGPASGDTGGDIEGCDECDDSGICEGEVEEGNDGCGNITLTFNSDVFVATLINGETESSYTSGSAIAPGESVIVKLKKPFSSMSAWEKTLQATFSDGRVISIRKKDSDPDGFDDGPTGPDNIGDWPLPGGDDCSSCNGTGSHRSYDYYGMNTNVASREENTLANKSSYLGTDESDQVSAVVNFNGSPFRVDKQDGYSTVEYAATIESVGVKGFTVTDNKDNEYYYYEEGTEMPEKPKLRKVIRQTESSTETITYNYDGDELLSQQDASGNKIEYYYNTNDDTLEQIKFYNGTTSTYESRTVDFTYNTDGKLEEIKCSSCNDAQIEYVHVPSNAVDYDESLQQNVPRRYYLSAIIDADDTQVAYYNYDNEDRITEYRLGTSTGDLVTAWTYTEEDEELQIERRDYVDSTNYRLTYYNYGTDNALVSVVQYHQLQSSGSLDGTASTTGYSIVNDTQNDKSESITTYPSGLKRIKETILDDTDVANGYVRRELKKSGTTELVSQEYTYTEETNGGVTKILKETVERNNVHTTNDPENDTNYEYASNFKVKRVHGPTITSGVTGDIPGRSDSRKEYDSLDRVKYSFSKNSNNEWVGSEYEYTSEGKIDNVINDVVFTLDGNGVVTNQSYSNAVTTAYTYNAFGDLTETCLLEVSDKKQIRRFYYNNDGVKTGEATLLTEEVGSGESPTTAAEVISAVKYTYDGNGRLIIKSVVKSNITFPETDSTSSGEVADLEDDLDVALAVDTTTHQVEGCSGLGLTWVHTVTVYDTYGLRTAVVQDATEEGGSARQHLKTEYEYNNQGEVKEVKSPSGKVVKTTRDGRGLVVKEETGYYNSTPAFVAKITVEYTYDGDGNLTSKIEPHPNGDEDLYIKTVYRYDEFGRPRGSHTEKLDLSS